MKISSKISDVMTEVSDSIFARVFSYTSDMMFSWCREIIVDLMTQDLIYCLMIMMSQVTSNVVFMICRLNECVINAREYQTIVASITAYNYLVVSLSIEMILSWKFTLEIVVLWKVICVK